MDTNQNKLIRAGDAARSPLQYYISADEPIGYSYESDRSLPVHLMDYWRILLKRKWIVITTLLAIVVVAAIDTWKQTPIYRASLKLRIESEQSNILPFQVEASYYQPYVPTEEFLNTQIEALKSHTLATRVIRSLKLEKDARFIGEGQTSMLASALSWIRDQVRPAAGNTPVRSPSKLAPAKKDRRISPYAGLLSSGITVSPVRDTRIVAVGYDAADPVLAADILNTLADEFIQMNFETRYNASTTASEFLGKQLVDLKAQVEQSEEQLVKFGQDHDIYSLGEKENVIMQKLVDLNTALTGAQAERIQKESVWKIVLQSPPGQFPDILRSEEIKSLESNVAQLQQQKARLRTMYKSDWPDVKQNDGQLAEAEKQLAGSRAAAVKFVETEYQAALQREQLLSDALEAQKLEANVLNQSSIQYNILKREVDSSKQLYDGLLRRMKEAGVAAGLKSNNIHIVDPAEPPYAPYKPDKLANIAKALILGFVIGIALAFFLEYLDAYFDRSIKTPEDIDRFIKLPFLGLIPSLSAYTTSKRRHLRGVSRLKKGLNGRSEPEGTEAVQSVELITYSDKQSTLSEAYRSLRTSVLLSSSADRAPKVLLITSSQKGEGKTTTAINLAITLAQTGEKVLLLDCDMRNPSIARAMGIDNANGISTALSGIPKEDKQLIQPSKVRNLFVFPAGQNPPNPAELIGSPRLKRYLAALQRFFDHIVIDSPPLLSVTDARILATMVDGVILVIRGGETTKEAVERSRRLLMDVHARILGTLLNNVNTQSTSYYYYSKYYYGYGYGYGYGSEKEQSGKSAHEPCSAA